ncbi:MAG: diaminopimelate epimerase [Sedimentisphaerales bacterium]|nr:diaminopimelate epimerase [Sedimentisphaerales bacterium]
MRFTKMHGIGNDYIYVNCFEEKVDNPGEVAVKISNRHFGVGADGLILICPSDKADVSMRMFNADGSEAEMCGNGIRCVAKYTIDHGLSSAKPLKVQTGNGIMAIDYQLGDDGKMVSSTVNMGQPKLRPAEIPVNIEGENVIDRIIEVVPQQLNMTCVSMGNPHTVFFCDDVEQIDLEKIGPVIENHKLFPNRTNVHFVQLKSSDHLKMRTWERGSGITLACGTGACAVCVAGVLNRRSERVCRIDLPGGQLQINWCEDDNCVYMTGPAEEIFEGTWLL